MNENTDLKGKMISWDLSKMLYYIVIQKYIAKVINCHTHCRNAINLPTYIATSLIYLILLKKASLRSHSQK